MVKEKSDKKKETPALTGVQEDIEMGDVAPKKAKKEKEETVILVEDLSPLAHPLAQKKLVKKLHKIIKKGMDIFPSRHNIGILKKVYNSI